MRIKRLHIENFGTLHDFRMELSDPLHVVHEENGWGKSTLAVFIKAMFYGLPGGTVRSLDKNERKKYTPWQGGAFGGSLEFETADGAFRIERFFGAKESGDSYALYDLATNRPTNRYAEPLGEALFGIDADGFERTVYLSQREMGKGENNSITARLGSLLDDAPDIGSFEEAIEALEKRRKYYVLTGNRGHIAEVEEALRQKRRELEGLEAVATAVAEEERLLAEETGQIGELEADLATTRENLRAAGLLRERAAHLEQRDRMMREIHTMEASRRTLEESMGGKHPTDACLIDAQSILKRIRTNEAWRKSVPTEKTAVEQTELLPPSHFTSCPDERLLDKMSSQNERYADLARRAHDLRSAQSAMGDQGLTRLPREEQLQEMLAAVDRMAYLSNQIEHGEAPKASERPILPWILGIVGAVLAMGGLIPLAAVRIPCVAVGVILMLAALIVGLSGRATVRREVEAQRRRREALCRERDALSQKLEQFLSAYGCRDQRDPVRALTELSLAVRRRREDALIAEERRTELARVEEEMQGYLRFLIPSFRLFGVEPEKRADYRNDIERLRRDLIRVRQAKERDAENVGQRRNAEEAIASDLDTLDIVIRAYAPDWRSDPEGTIERLRENEAEFRRLTGSIRTKRAELAAFVADKQLSEEGTELDGASYEALLAEEKELQGQLNAQRSAANRRRTKIDNLSLDADRIPEVESELSQLEEELAEAQANSNTIGRTKQFLEEAKESLSTRYLEDMQAAFARFLAVLTANEAPESVMEPSFEVSLRSGGKTRSMESFSRGWRDAVQFCVRLSLAEALYAEGEKPFLLLDDPFVNLDDTRLSAARHLLETLSREYQIIYMVCHADRK